MTQANLLGSALRLIESFNVLQDEDPGLTHEGMRQTIGLVSTTNIVWAGRRRLFTTEYLTPQAQLFVLPKGTASRRFIKVRLTIDTGRYALGALHLLARCHWDYASTSQPDTQHGLHNASKNPRSSQR